MELSNYLIPSHSIEITVKTRDDQNKTNDLILKSVIERGIENDTFKIIAPIYHGTVYNIHIGEILTISFSSPDSTNKQLYSVTCKVSDRHFSQNMSTLDLLILSKPLKIQRRQAFRVNIYNTYSFIYKGTPQELITKDISCTGMLALTSVQLHSNTIITLKLDTNIKPKDALDSDYSELKVFDVRCKILDSTPQSEIRRYINRIQFIGMSEQESKYLIQYLYSKQTEMIHLDPKTSDKLNQFFESDGDQFVDTTTKEYKSIQLISLAGLILIFIALITFLFAQPKKMYVLDYFFDFHRPQFWDTYYLSLAVILSSVVILLGISGLIMNLREVKKNNSTIHWTLIVTTVIAITIILIIINIASINNLPLF